MSPDRIQSAVRVHDDLAFSRRCDENFFFPHIIRTDESAAVYNGAELDGCGLQLRQSYFQLVVAPFLRHSRSVSVLFLNAWPAHLEPAGDPVPTHPTAAGSATCQSLCPLEQLGVQVTLRSVCFSLAVFQPSLPASHESPLHINQRLFLNLIGN